MAVYLNNSRLGVQLANTVLNIYRVFDSILLKTSVNKPLSKCIEELNQNIPFTDREHNTGIVEMREFYVSFITSAYNQGNLKDYLNKKIVFDEHCMSFLYKNQRFSYVHDSITMKNYWVVKSGHEPFKPILTDAFLSRTNRINVEGMLPHFEKDYVLYYERANKGQGFYFDNFDKEMELMFFISKDDNGWKDNIYNKQTVKFLIHK